MKRSIFACLVLLAAFACLAAETTPGAQVERYKPKLRSKDKKEREEAYNAYLAAGQEGRKLLRDELLSIRRELVARCREVYLSDETQKKLLKAHEVMENARKEALRVIRDTRIYPDADHGRAGQPIVDKAVAAVKAIHPQYQSVFGPVLSRFEGVPRAYERILEIDGQLTLCDVSDVELKPPLSKLVGADLKPELVEILLAAADYRDYVRRCLLYNQKARTSATSAERRLVDVTNEYRIQLGLKPLAINELLMQAARKHSAEMAALGYFGHDSPKPENRSPQQRCQNEGYSGCRGENCASGAGPEGAFSMWYNSSGHHRNMIGSGINEIGVGFAGPWTEDFGRSPDLDLDNPPRQWKRQEPRDKKTRNP